MAKINIGKSQTISISFDCKKRKHMLRYLLSRDYRIARFNIRNSKAELFADWCRFRGGRPLSRSNKSSLCRTRWMMFLECRYLTRKKSRGYRAVRTSRIAEQAGGKHPRGNYAASENGGEKYEESMQECIFRKSCGGKWVFFVWKWWKICGNCVEN